MSTPTVFISYRRGDADPVARQIAKDLKDDLGHDNVFIDTSDLWAGDRFDTRIEQRIRRADVVIALVGPSWAGGERINESGDWVRREIALALKSRGDVVPVLVDGGRLPTSLPRDLRRLARIQHLVMDADDYRLAYQSVLVAVWQRLARRQGRVLAVSDDSDRAEVHIDELARTLGSVDVAQSRVLSGTVARGLRAIPVSTAAQRWPKVFVVRTDDHDELPPVLAARLRGLLQSRGARTVGVFTAGGVVTKLGEHALPAVYDTVTEAFSSAGGGTQTSVGEAGQHATVVAPGEHVGQLSNMPSVSDGGASGAGAAAPSVGDGGSGGAGTSMPSAEPVGSTGSGWWGSLTTAAKAAVVAPILAAGVLVGVLLDDDPITLQGAWDVSDFEFVSDTWTTSADLSGGFMRFEPVEGCTDEPCPLVIVEGPTIVNGLVMDPVDGGSEYVSDDVNLISNCDGVEVPPDVVDRSLTARAGPDDDLEFVITTEIGSWGRCDAATSQYSATARRASS